MKIAIIVSCVIAICSCLQIHLYTPFKNRKYVVAMAAFFAISSFVTDRYLHLQTVSWYHFIPFFFFVVTGLGAIMICCHTRFFCGLYNVVIQMCINMLVQILGHNPVLFSFMSKKEGEVFYIVISILLSLIWYLVMKRLRRSVWIQMPQADEYYHMVAVLVVLDYLFGLCVDLCWWCRAESGEESLTSIKELYWKKKK